MEAMAIICEYNPFHNGHAYQISQHRSQYNVDCVIAVMSGNFVQRGAPAICDKWVRAEMALYGGCDLVVELPVVYAVQSAERFAQGAVRLIHQMPHVHYLSFGSECGDIASLRTIAQTKRRPSFIAEVIHHSKTGIPYPTACADILCKMLGEDFRHILSEPNNILAIEYLKALDEQNSNITPITLKRTIAHHHNKIDEQFCSAGYLRSLMQQHHDISSLMSPETYWVYKTAERLGKTPVSNVALDVLVPYLLRTKTTDELLNIPDMTEGLESRFREAGRKFHDLQSVAEFIKSKRYTRTRVDRMLTHLLLGITKEDINLSPSYLRVLGMNRNGADYLKMIKEKSPVPIITKTTKCSELAPDAQKMFALDCHATDIYAMLYPNQSQNRAGLDFITSPIIHQRGL